MELYSFICFKFLNLFLRFDPRGPLAFKMEMKQLEPQEEEIPIRAMSALKISRKHRPQRHHPYYLPTWGQIKTLTNRAENLVSQQGLPPSPESWQCSVFWPVPPPAGPRLISNPHLFRSDQSLSRVRLFATPGIAARQASLSITNSWSSLRLTSIESVMPSSHLILCRPFLLLSPIPPSTESSPMSQLFA